jgi:hypothetical protein
MSRSVPPEQAEPFEWVFYPVPVQLGATIAHAVVPQSQRDMDMQVDFNYDVQFFEPGTLGVYVVNGLMLI